MTKQWFARLFRHHRPHTNLDLLAPPSLSEVLIAVHADGNRRMTLQSKHEGDARATLLIDRSVIEAGFDLFGQHVGWRDEHGRTPQEIAETVTRIISVGMEFAKQANLKVEMKNT